MNKTGLHLEDEIVWSQEFATGIPRIDIEHRIFLDLINTYRIALMKRADKSVLQGIINEIEKYAQFHFAREENLMKAIEYPKYKEHCMLHYNVIEELNMAKNDDHFPIKFLEFIYKWFVFHTAREDKGIAAFIKSKELKFPGFTGFEI